MGDFDWGAVWYAVPYMLQGALVTLEISACAMVVASLVGLVMGLISASDFGPLKVVIRAYVYFVRGTPALKLPPRPAAAAPARSSRRWPASACRE